MSLPVVDAREKSGALSLHGCKERWSISQRNSWAVRDRAGQGGTVARIRRSPDGGRGAGGLGHGEAEGGDSGGLKHSFAAAERLAGGLALEGETNNTHMLH